MLGLTDIIVKNWEKEFPQVKPVRNRADNRYYMEKDLALLFFIKEKLFEKKLSITEVKKEIRNYRKEINQSESTELKKVLAEVKLEISEIQELLESH
jgi:DNA-binding transcriptional MerR regulator